MTAYQMRVALIALCGVLFSSATLAQAPVIPCISATAGGCTPVTTTNPLPSAIYSSGSVAQVSLDGALSVNTPPNPQFADTFSAALDTTTNWTNTSSTGTAATSSGNLVINSSTTASAWGGVASQQAFAPVGVSSQVWGTLASFTVLAQANSTRVFGVFNAPGSPTTAIPVTDGYVYRLDGTGQLFAEIWASSVAVSSTNVTANCLPSANFPGIFAIVFRANLVQFTCGAALPVALAPVLGINPTNQVLNVGALSIAGSTPPAASAVVNLSAFALATISPGAVKSPSQAPNINDPAAVVSVSPNGNHVENTARQLAGTDTFSNAQLGVTPADGVFATSLMNANAAFSFGGTTWERNFACPNTAVVNVTAAATTEIVSLTAAQVIRVCSMALTMSAAGTATIVNGTGTNCGTGTASLTGAMNLGTSVPLAMGSGYGSVLRTASGNALCISAVTGNVTGFITYAKY